MKTLLLLLFLNSAGPFPLTWNKCKRWVAEQYEKVFPNQPKTVKESKDWANSVYKKAILRNDSLLLAEAYYLYGKLEFATHKDYLKAKLWFNKSLNILKKYPPSYELSRVYLWLGYNEHEVRNYNQSLAFAQKSAKVSEVIQDEKAMADAYWRLAAIYSPEIFTSDTNYVKFVNIDSTQKYISKAKNNAIKSRSTAILTVIEMQESTRDSLNKIELLEKALKNIVPKDEKATIKVWALLKLSNNYLDIGKLDLAETRLAEARRALQKISYFPDLEKAIEITQIRLLEKQFRWQEAYISVQKLREDEQRLWSKEKLKVINDMEEQHKALLSENENIEINFHKENIILQRKLLWVSGFLIAVSLITTGMFFLLSRKNRQISKQNALLVQEQNHRFNNNLQTISSLLTLKSNELSTEDAKTVFSESKLLIQAIASLQRKLYSSDKLVSVQLHHLIPEVVSEVLAAFNMSKVKTVFEIPPLEVYADDALNLNLIFTELTINACKHAFNTIDEPYLKITINSKGEQISFLFRDNGAEKINYSLQSFGMFLITQLVKQMQGNHMFYYDNGTVCEVKCKVKTLA